MITLELAKQLKEAGLKWEPRTHDFFAVPFPDLDHRIFVLSDMTINQEVLHGWPALTFSGAMEWALDYILTMDVVWLPTEEQLRDQLQRRLDPVKLLLIFERQYCRLEINSDTRASSYEGATAAEAYGQALLALLSPN